MYITKCKKEHKTNYITDITVSNRKDVNLNGKEQKILVNMAVAAASGRQGSQTQDNKLAARVEAGRRLFIQPELGHLGVIC